MQVIRNQDNAGKSVPKGYVWQSDELAMVNTLMSAAWHHEMDQQSFINTKIGDMFKKIGVARRRVIRYQ